MYAGFCCDWALGLRQGVGACEAPVSGCSVANAVRIHLIVIIEFSLSPCKNESYESPSGITTTRPQGGGSPWFSGAHQRMGYEGLLSGYVVYRSVSATRRSGRTRCSASHVNTGTWEVPPPPLNVSVARNLGASWVRMTS